MADTNQKNHADNADFEDVFSSSKQDAFEDLYSDSHAQEEEPAFEDIYSGRKDTEPVPEEDPYAGFFTDSPLEEEPQAPKTPPAPMDNNPEKMPYHYNENAPKRTRARNGDEIVLREDEEAPKRKKKKHIGRKIFCIVLVLILLFVGGAGLFAYTKAKSILGAVDYVPLGPNVHTASGELLSEPYLKNILLIGVDARAGEEAEKTRSDTMMLVTIDTKHKQVKLTSFLRDMYVEIPDYRSDKINAAQSHGGTQLLVDTIEKNFKIDIDNYMLVSFDMFTTIIDKLGGVDVEITKKEAKYINSRDHMDIREVYAFPEKLEEGMQHFDGVQALWYARIRYLDSDFMRTARQRKVITAIVKKAVKQSPLTLVQMAEEIMPMVKTGLTEDELWDLATHALSYLKFDIVQQQIPADKAYKSQKKRGQSVLVPDMEKNVQILQGFLKSDVAVEEETTEKK